MLYELFLYAFLPLLLYIFTSIHIYTLYTSTQPVNRSSFILKKIYCFMAFSYKGNDEENYIIYFYTCVWKNL